MEEGQEGVLSACYMYARVPARARGFFVVAIASGKVKSTLSEVETQIRERCVCNWSVKLMLDGTWIDLDRGRRLRGFQGFDKS